MKCYSCKATIPDDATTCPACGKDQGFDARAIRAASRGDQAALTELYEKTYSSVYNTIKFLVRDDDAALDILQDSYVKAFRSLDMLQDPSRFGAWMRRIAHNRAVDYLRQAKPVSLSSLTADESGEEVELVDDRPDSLPDLVIDQRETARLLGEILDALPDDQRVCVTLYYYEQLSVHEIAQELDVPEATVKSRLMYGRKKIEQQVKALERRGTKLYSVAPVALLMWLFRNQQAQAAVLPSAAVLQAALGSVATSSGAAASGAAAGTGTAGAAGTSSAGGSAAAAGSAAGAGAAAAAGGGIASKAIAAAVALALVAGGGTLAARALFTPKPAALPVPQPVSPTSPSVNPYDVIMNHYVDRLCAVPSEFLAWYDQGHDHGYADGINNELIAELFRTRAKLWYGKVDINGDGIDELLLGTAGDGWTQCWDAYTMQGDFAVPLFTGDNVLEYRKNLLVLPDGTLDLHASGGVDAGTDAFFRIIDGGAGLEPADPPRDISGAVDALSWGGIQLKEIPYQPGQIDEDAPAYERTQPIEPSEAPDTPGAAVSTDGIFDAYQEVLRAYETSMNADPATDPIYDTYDWARTWIDTRGEGASVEHAEVDLNGDGVPEMVMAAYVNYGDGWEEWYPFEIYTYDGANAIALFVGQITTADWLHLATDGTMWTTRGNADPTPVRRWELPAGATQLAEIASAGSEDELPRLSYASVLRPPAV